MFGKEGIHSEAKASAQQIISLTETKCADPAAYTGMDRGEEIKDESAYSTDI